MDPTKPCLCGTGLAYGACCGPLHDGTRPAATAEQLMRSRYTAFALKLVDYLLATLHPGQRRPGDRAELASSLKRMRWTGLRVVDTAGGTALDATGEVAFEATWTAKGQTGVMRERSRFARVDGRWVYVDGDVR